MPNKMNNNQKEALKPQAISSSQPFYIGAGTNLEKSSRFIKQHSVVQFISNCHSFTTSKLCPQSK